MTKNEYNKITKMEKDIEFIKESLKKMPTTEGMKLANEELLKNIFKETDKRYACKDVERLVNKMIWLVVSAVILGGLAFIIEPCSL